MFPGHTYSQGAIVYNGEHSVAQHLGNITRKGLVLYDAVYLWSLYTAVRIPDLAEIDLFLPLQSF